MKERGCLHLSSLLSLPSLRPSLVPSFAELSHLLRCCGLKRQIVRSSIEGILRRNRKEMPPLGMIPLVPVCPGACMHIQGATEHVQGCGESSVCLSLRQGSVFTHFRGNGSPLKEEVVLFFPSI